MAGITAWRTNDVVAYEAMRETATMLAALLIRSAASGTALPTANSELLELRVTVLNSDVFDRATVAALTTRFRERIAQLAEPQT